MKEETRRDFAYYALSACALLQFAGNWMLALCGWGLGVYGASELSARGARHYGAAVVCGGACMVLTIARPLPVGPLGFAVFELLTLLAAPLFFVLVCLGLAVQLREAGFGGKIEWTLIALFAAGTAMAVGAIVGERFGILNAMTLDFAEMLATVLALVSPLALFADLLRARKRLTGE